MKRAIALLLICCLISVILYLLVACSSEETESTASGTMVSTTSKEEAEESTTINPKEETTEPETEELSESEQPIISEENISKTPISDDSDYQEPITSIDPVVLYDIAYDLAPWLDNYFINLYDTVDTNGVFINYDLSLENIISMSACKCYQQLSSNPSSGSEIIVSKSEFIDTIWNLFGVSVTSDTVDSVIQQNQYGLYSNSSEANSKFYSDLFVLIDIKDDYSYVISEAFNCYTVITDQSAAQEIQFPNDNSKEYMIPFEFSFYNYDVIEGEIYTDPETGWTHDTSTVSDVPSSASGRVVYFTFTPCEGTACGWVISQIAFDNHVYDTEVLYY